VHNEANFPPNLPTSDTIYAEGQRRYASAKKNPQNRRESRFLSRGPIS
jgi:hypothetical protein